MRPQSLEVQGSVQESVGPEPEGIEVGWEKLWDGLSPSPLEQLSAGSLGYLLLV